MVTVNGDFGTVFYCRGRREDMRRIVCLFVFFAGLTYLVRGADADMWQVHQGQDTIQQTIEVAADGDVIIVNPGTYSENINFLGKEITLISTNPDDPNIVQATVIDGSLTGDPNNGSVVTFNSGENNSSVLTGFTITGGIGTWLVIAWELHEPYWNLCGGGVVCYNMSQPTISRNIIRDNTAGEGGGVYVYGDPVNINAPSNPPVHITPVIADNTFLNNSAIKVHGYPPPDNDYPAAEHGDGGAIVCFQGVDAAITGNTIQNNHADFYGGGLHLRQWSNGEISNNQIISNDSALGAGVHITYMSSPTIRRNTIQGNSAGNFGGGGIFVYYNSNPLIERNRVRANSSLTGAGISINYGSAGIVRNNLIDQNLLGSAIQLAGSSPWINHNTIVYNVAKKGTSRYAGIEFIGNSFPLVENNIIAFTSSGYGLYVSGNSIPVMRYNNLWENELGHYGPGLTDQTGTAGNISVDPDLICDADKCLRLHYLSPCVNTGDPNYTSGGTVDFDGDPRVVLSRTDIGADEVLPVWNITSGQQYLTIQAGIDQADTGDILLVLPGRYAETINFNGRVITLQSTMPSDWATISQTIIDAEGSDNPVVSFSGTEDPNCQLNGFTITGASHNGNGGGVYGQGTQASITNCIITNNYASNGAGIYDFDGFIYKCQILTNNAQFDGGGIGLGDGAIFSCVIAHNQADQGGGLHAYTGDIVNNTIVDNTAVSSGGGAQDCVGNITNCIFWGNSAPDGSDLKNCYTPQYSCVQQGTGGNGSIDDDPFFVDPDHGDYHLTLFSPCVDLGNNSAVPAAAATDLDDQQRIFALDPGKPPVVDMGADEVVTNPVDVNMDAWVDIYEMTLLAQQWLTQGENLLADFFPDDMVDMKDFSALASQWLWQGYWYKPPAGALEFDHDSDGYVWIHTPEGNILNNVYTFTYTAWIYPLSFSSGNARIIGKNERALMISYGGTLVGYSNGFYTALSHSQPCTLETNKWYFVAMTRDISGDNKIRLYVDGDEAIYQTQLVSTQMTHPHPDWRAEGQWDLMIGSQAWTPGNDIPDAIIDEVAIFDRVLSIDDIKYLYNIGYGRSVPLSMYPIGLWHLDEGSNSTAIDSSGYGNHGALIGTQPPQWGTGKF